MRVNASASAAARLLAAMLAVAVTIANAAAPPAPMSREADCTTPVRRDGSNDPPSLLFPGGDQNKVLMLAPNYPGITYEQAVGNHQGPPPTPPGVPHGDHQAASLLDRPPQAGNFVGGTFDWRGSLRSLAESFAVSAATMDPSYILSAGLTILIDFFVNGDEFGPSAEEKFQESVQSKLDMIQVCVHVCTYVPGFLAAYYYRFHEDTRTHCNSLCMSTRRLAAFHAAIRDRMR